MGVPGFFLWLIKKFKNIFILETINETIDILYLDANCLIHPQCRKVLELDPKWSNNDILEAKMVKRIAKYIDFLIDYTQPREVYIAVDGVAPVAKIKQQRIRRFKSLKDKQITDNIKKKYKVPISKNWDTQAISPGTSFMKKITETMSKFTKKNVKVTFVSADTPGEGEHKILQHIKQNKHKVRVVYGLDADLIFLSLACQKEKIYLLREKSHLQEKTAMSDNTSFFDFDDPQSVMEELLYVSIDMVKECIGQCLPDTSTNQFIKDFIFMCYFMGNDFLPHFPSIDIKKGGLDILLNCYTECYTQLKHQLFQDDKTVSEKFLVKFLEYLTKAEHEYFIVYQEHEKRRHYKRANSSNPYDIELFNLNNLKFKIEDPIKLGVGDETAWKKRYYDHYFWTHAEKDIENICAQYLKGLIWISHYYFDKCCSWNWYYPFDHPPFVSDLYEFVKKNPGVINSFKFELSEPLHPTAQLLAIFPPTCSYLLPKEHQYLMTSPKSPIIDMYPINFVEDMLYKDMWWQCIPMLPPLDVPRIKKAIKLKP
jgi:5'-3' exonuclease